VCLSIWWHSHGRISWSIFTKIGTDIRTPKSKNEFVRGSISHHPLPYFVPPKLPFQAKRSWKPMQILSNPISDLNVRESPKFSCLLGNRGRGTQWWLQILDWNWKYGRFTRAQWKIHDVTLIYGRIAEISASFRKSGSRNTIRCLWHKPARGNTILFLGCIAHAL